MDDGDSIARMQDELRRVVARPRLAAHTDAPVTPIGAAAVEQRLQQLLAQGERLSEMASALAAALAGAEERQGRDVPRPSHPETVWGKQLVRLDELALVLDTVEREIGRARNTLG